MSNEYNKSLEQQSQRRFENIKSQVSDLWVLHEQFKKKIKFNMLMTNILIFTSILAILFIPDLIFFGWGLLFIMLGAKIYFIKKLMLYWKSFYSHCEKFAKI